MGRCGDQCGCWWVGGREFCVIPVSYRSGLERREGFGVFLALDALWRFRRVLKKLGNTDALS